MTVDVVIVNWNGGPELITAVESALRFGARVIVVDNASSHGTIGTVAGKQPVTVLRHVTNRGFAAGCNSGVAAGDGEYVVLLNPDAEIVAGDVQQLEAVFGSTSATVVGLRLEHSSGRKLLSIHPFPSVVDLLVDLLRIRAVTQRFRGEFHQIVRPLARQPLVPTAGWVVGAALAIRRRDWQRVGGMDERFFLWYEDIDFGARVARAGGSVVLAPSILVRHQGAVSWTRLSRRRRQWLRVLATRRYAWRHLGPGAVAALAAAAPLALVIGVALDVAHWLLRRS